MKKWLWIVFLVDILLQGYFRRLGYGTMNRGISFGWWPGISLLVMVGVYLVFFGWGISGLRKGDRPVAWLAMVLGGLGNLLQRLWLGSVWDYLYFPLLGFWFNLADALITMGVICYIFDENLLPARKR